jgi:hypothetical protein
MPLGFYNYMEYEMKKLKFKFNESDESYEETASENDKVIEDNIKRYEKYYDDLIYFSLSKDDRALYDILVDGLVHNDIMSYDTDCINAKRSLNLMKLGILINFKYLKPRKGVNNEIYK